MNNYIFTNLGISKYNEWYNTQKEKQENIKEDGTDTIDSNTHFLLIPETADQVIWDINNLDGKNNTIALSYDFKTDLSNNIKSETLELIYELDYELYIDYLFRILKSKYIKYVILQNELSLKEYYYEIIIYNENIKINVPILNEKKELITIIAILQKDDLTEQEYINIINRFKYVATIDGKFKIANEYDKTQEMSANGKYDVYQYNELMNFIFLIDNDIKK